MRNLYGIRLESGHKVIISQKSFLRVYGSVLLLCPLLGVWDCMLRKMKYFCRPEWL